MSGFGYFYGMESEQYSFFRVPKALFQEERFKGLSCEAKVLYGLMLDRMGLSMKNGWLDGENRAYVIYTIDNIREDLGCSKDKAIKVLAELDASRGIGLVEKIRRGLGKPDVIYVKNFTAWDTGRPQEAEETDLKKSGKPTSRSLENRLQEVEKTDLKKSEKPTSRSLKNRPQEVEKTDPNNTEINNTEINETETNQTKINHTGSLNVNPIHPSRTNPIHPSGGEPVSGLDGKGTDRTDRIDSDSVYRKLVRENLEYDLHLEYDYRNNPYDRELYEEIYETICDMVCIRRDRVRINGQDYPYETVKSRFLKLNNNHVMYVMHCMGENTTKVKNIRSYLITALYNASLTMGHYYQQRVNYDMYGGGWAGSGSEGMSRDPTSQ